ERGAVLVRLAGERDHVHPVEHFRQRGRLEDHVVRAGREIVARALLQRGLERRFLAERDEIETIDVALANCTARSRPRSNIVRNAIAFSRGEIDSVRASNVSSSGTGSLSRYSPEKRGNGPECRAASRASSAV